MPKEGLEAEISKLRKQVADLQPFLHYFKAQKELAERLGIRSIDLELSVLMNTLKIEELEPESVHSSQATQKK